ncbi:hypothetical protein OU994_15150 [Pseudoduganella sp. SL102]|uniref:Uncharacterized protein n=1 Tax=Pseudoduganella albidiflava TaxID=321983 RepID=A0A411WZC4_9BURK|nr:MULTISPECIES: hypothetical protein [Pseudoduganella]QBI02052.1 hypothetical protein EYF70_15210 [Pseudoduganella albidiflava]WBS05519.1 hypothetical protein OU994_15150 [Pseudoduganella sp. SL102]GGY65168.1 hypothetical protein GCM10007387_54360 [Pseudoduganella albidiflava]
MEKHHTSGPAPHYTLGLEKVEIDDVLDACGVVGAVLKAVAPDLNTRSAARLLAEATRLEYHNEPLTRSILVEVARALQRRETQ